MISYDFDKKRVKEVDESRRRKLIIKKGEMKWERSTQASGRAMVIDQYSGFNPAIINTFIGEIGPGLHSGKHKHGEACIYILEGKGYSVIGDRKVNWEAGDGLYIPPNTFHQHFNRDKKKRVRYYAATATPLLINLSRYFYEQAEYGPGWKKKGRVLNS